MDKKELALKLDGLADKLDNLPNSRVTGTNEYGEYVSGHLYELEDIIEIIDALGDLADEVMGDKKWRVEK